MQFWPFWALKLQLHVNYSNRKNFSWNMPKTPSEMHMYDIVKICTIVSRIVSCLKYRRCHIMVVVGGSSGYPTTRPRPPCETYICYSYWLLTYNRVAAEIITELILLNRFVNLQTKEINHAQRDHPRDQHYIINK